MHALSWTCLFETMLFEMASHTQLDWGLDMFGATGWFHISHRSRLSCKGFGNYICDQVLPKSRLRTTEHGMLGMLDETQCSCHELNESQLPSVLQQHAVIHSSVYLKNVI
jgi:hypothetical protein